MPLKQWVFIRCYQEVLIPDAGRWRFLGEHLIIIITIMYIGGRYLISNYNIVVSMYFFILFLFQFVLVILIPLILFNESLARAFLARSISEAITMDLLGG